MIIIHVGGTFALYSLICRYARVSLIPNHQVEDRELSNYRLDTPSNQLRRAENIKEKLENSKVAQLVLFLVTILGTSMVIGDGVLTPCISGESYLSFLIYILVGSIYSKPVSSRGCVMEPGLNGLRLKRGSLNLKLSLLK